MLARVLDGEVRVLAAEGETITDRERPTRGVTDARPLDSLVRARAVFCAGAGACEVDGPICVPNEREVALCERSNAAARSRKRRISLSNNFCSLLSNIQHETKRIGHVITDREGLNPHIRCESFFHFVLLLIRGGIFFDRSTCCSEEIATQQQQQQQQ
jgi:hypothetical protein